MGLITVLELLGAKDGLQAVLELLGRRTSLSRPATQNGNCNFGTGRMNGNCDFATTRVG